MVMLHSIRTRPQPPPSEEPVDLLLACHGRLRQFSTLALAVATRADLSAEQVKDACDELARYFRLALPLHEADEEVTLAPALAPLMKDAEALDRMRDQHAMLHETLAVLLPLWDARAREKTLVPARKLAAILDVHLALEEATIFPLVAEVPAPERKRLFEEMRRRRAL